MIQVSGPGPLAKRMSECMDEDDKGEVWASANAIEPFSLFVRQWPGMYGFALGVEFSEEVSLQSIFVV